MAKTTPTTPDAARARRFPGRPRPAAPGGGGRSPGGDGVTRPTLSPLTFFQESRAELRKVTWPTRQEAMNLTTAVIGMTVALAIFLGLIDAGLDQLITKLIGA